MRLTQHPSNNGVLRAPPGASIEECRPAPITRTQYEDGSHAVTTYWQLSAEEVSELVLMNRHLKITVLGRTMPPMLVEIEK